MTPPPIPKAVSHQIFYGHTSKGGLRLAGATLLNERIQSAHQQAEEWLNANRSVEVLSITNGSAENAGASSIFVAVWYREA